MSEIYIGDKVKFNINEIKCKDSHNILMEIAIKVNNKYGFSFKAIDVKDGIVTLGYLNGEALPIQGIGGGKWFATSLELDN